MFLEGICPSGAKKVPNSVAHAVHKKHSGDQHEHHHHHHQEHQNHGDEKESLMDVMDEGFHYVDNLENVVPKYFPNAKQIGRQRIEMNPDMKEIFDVLHMEYFLISVYKL